MSFRCGTFLLSEALTDIRRHSLMTLASISTVAVSLSILGGFLLMALHLHAIADALPRQIEIHAFTRPEVTPEQLKGLEARIRTLPGLTHVQLISRDEAWREFQRKFPDPNDLAGMRENPLPDKFEIRARSPQRTLAVAGILRTYPEIARVNEGGPILERLISVSKLVRSIGLTCAALLLLATLAVISNAIRVTLFARRREIRIMQLVGATNGFIRLPFLFEGVLDGALGAVAACALVGIGYHYLTEAAWISLPLLREFQPPIGLPQFFVLLATIGVAIGALGSFISIRRFLKI
jgi:cell division transport system permease protein